MSNDGDEQTRIQLVLFDLDNTLFDHQGSAAMAVDMFLDGLGITATRQLQRQWFDLENTVYQSYLDGEISFIEQRRILLQRFMPLAGVAAPKGSNELDVLFGRYLKEYERAWRVFPDAMPVLSRVRDQGLKSVILTNGEHEQQIAKVQRIALAPLVEHTFSSGRLEYAKPDPRAFWAACDAMRVDPANTLYVGDNYGTDYLGAKAAGLHSLHLDRGGQGNHWRINLLNALDIDLLNLLRTLALGTWHRHRFF